MPTNLQAVIVVDMLLCLRGAVAPMLSEEFSMQEPVDGIVGVMRSTIAQAQHSNEAMAMSVTFALCLFHASRPPSAEEPQVSEQRPTIHRSLA